MENSNQISQCQTLWARNKYLVLSHSSKIYLEIRQYLKSDSVETAHVQDDFMHLLLRYQSGQAEQKDLVTAVRNLLVKYPNPYLQQSTLLFGDEA